ncbi:MAG: SH3 domain-containing protein [Anaerolineae bacterium]|nr:SH3 domain-containing protein [Anaerolineae bacterium]
MTKTTLLFGLLGVILAVIGSFSTAQPDSPQGSCPGLVDVALEAAASSCGDLGRNQACYGHTLIDAQGRDETVSFEFSEAGDVADLYSLASLDLSPMDINGESWGVSILKVQANLPDTLPGQNVTFILFGDTYFEDQTPVTVEVPLTTMEGVNVRIAPSSNARLHGSLAVGETVNATGRYDEWVRIDYATERAQLTGWVIASVLSGDQSTLPEVEPTSQNLSPMQAFYFTTGIGEITCREAPLDGLLLQTPNGAGMMSFVANGVEIALGSTAFLQAVPGDQLTIQLLEGSGYVKAGGVTQRLLPGSITLIPLDEDGWANGAPTFPIRSTDCRQIVTLVQAIKLLPESVSIAEGACVMPTLGPSSTRGQSSATLTPTPTGLLNLPTLDPSISPTWTPIGFATDTPTPLPTPNLLPCEGHPTDVGMLDVTNNSPDSTGVSVVFKVVSVLPDCTLGPTVAVLNPGESYFAIVPVGTYWDFYDDPNAVFYGNLYIALAGNTYRFCYPNAC